MASQIHPEGQKFRINASVVARYFKHRCDRLFRWDAVETSYRGRRGIGWNVPSRIRSHSRPGIRLLMDMGDEFEAGTLQTLMQGVGKERVLHAGFEVEGGRTTVAPLPLTELARCLTQRPLPVYIAQLDIDLNEHPTAEAQILRRFGLDLDLVRVGVTRPDLLEVLAPSQAGNPYRLRIWDFKATQAARHEHFVQVGYYSFVLEQVLQVLGFPDIELDTQIGVIYTREGKEEFELAPYRLAVEDFLRNRAPILLSTPAADVHYHMREKCAMCEYMDHCRSEADAHYDLCRIAYLSSESKRQLRTVGIATHRGLAQQAGADGDGSLLEQLRTSSHDLSVNLSRYVATAQALEDGIPRPLDASTLQMPQYEDVRIILCAEQDPVTNSCFALGLKTFEGWDEVQNRPVGQEEVIVAAQPGSEAMILLRFLQTLNWLLQRVDAENRVVADGPIEQEPAVVAAQEALDRATADLSQFKETHQPLRRTNPRYEELTSQRDALDASVKEAKQNLRQVQKTVTWERSKRQTRVHFYVYDRLDLLILKDLIERHLFDLDPPELLDEIRTLVRLFPPESVLPDADTFRSMPGTVVVHVLRSTVALPVPYLYNLQRVSELYLPANAAGQEGGYRYRPRYGFGWEYSNQVAFERIHDVWKGERWTPDSRDPDRVMSPGEILATIELTVRNKLRATDSVIRKLKQDLGNRLLLRKEPFQLYSNFDPLEFRILGTLRIFSLLETSLAELQVKHVHTLPVEDRTAKFESMRGLQIVAKADGGSFWFTFDSGSRDAKFEVGDFNLVLTPEDRPERLLGEVDGDLFNPSRWRHESFRVTLEEFDLAVSPPRIRLRAKNAAKLREQVDLSQPCVLDRLYADFNTSKVLETLARLHATPEEARNLHELLTTGTVQEWSPPVSDDEGAERHLRQRMSEAGLDPTLALNAGQWRAWRGILREPLTLIWGPPGTGKTYLLAHILLGYALAAANRGRPLRILVTAFTHHAINNVLKEVAKVAERYGVGVDQLSVAKVQGSTPNSADGGLPDRVGRVSDKAVGDYLTHDIPAQVIGSTVWGVHNAMRPSEGEAPRWFDVILVDEASQLKLPDALIAFSATKAQSNIVLAGDDRQLSPIIHGTYPEEHEAMLSSVFAFMRHRLEQRAAQDASVEERILFQLESNFRMNEPLTAYPRRVLYRDRYISNQPDVCIRTTVPLDPTSSDLVDFLLCPDRPVLLCHYASPRSFTARNVLEADLVARLVVRLSQVLVDPKTGQHYSLQGFASEGLAVLSPHRAQNSTIRHMLREQGYGDEQRPLPLVDTVDKLQGQERDVVLVSYGVADAEYAEAEAEFLLSSNRFNVAVTRARHKLIVFCSDAVLDVVPTDQRTLLDSMMLKKFRGYCSDGHRQFCWESPVGEVNLKIQWKGFEA